MHKLHIAGLIAGLGILGTRIKYLITLIAKNWSKFSPIIIPIIQQTEQASLSGAITKDKRKQLALNALDLAEKKGIIKMGWLENQVVDMVIDRISAKLPDFQISQQAQSIINEAISLMPKDVVAK